MHRVAGLRDRACLMASARLVTGGPAYETSSASARGFPRCPLSWRAPGVVPLLGEQRVRVAAGHLFARAPPRDYTRGGVRLFAAPAAGRGLTSELVAGAAWVGFNSSFVRHPRAF